MWIVIYIAQNREIAMTVQKLLQDAGLLVKLRSVGLRANDQYGSHEILLPEDEVEEGHNVLIEHLF